MGLYSVFLLFKEESRKLPKDSTSLNRRESMSKSNLIDMVSRIKKSGEGKSSDNGEVANVLSFAEKLAEKNNANRRKVTRTVLSQFVGVFIVLKNGVLEPTQLHDISTDGVSFDIGLDRGSFVLDESVTIRIYMSHDTYFSFAVTVTNLRVLEELGVTRHGAMFKKNTDNSAEALYHFVRFLETVSTVAKKDRGEKVSGRVD